MNNKLPYNGTSGWSGTDTSYERMVNDDRSGRTKARQRQARSFLATQYRKGVTWKELANELSWHHGQASAALTNLHKTGQIVRLTERRDRCRVYVLPQYQDGRTIDQPALRMSQTDMRSHLEWSLRHAKVWGDSELEKVTSVLLNLYWPERNDVEL